MTESECKIGDILRYAPHGHPTDWMYEIVYLNPVRLHTINAPKAITDSGWHYEGHISIVYDDFLSKCVRISK